MPQGSPRPLKEENKDEDTTADSNDGQRGSVSRREPVHGAGRDDHDAMADNDVCRDPGRPRRRHPQEPPARHTRQPHDGVP